MQAIKACPIDVPARDEKMFNQYENFQSDSREMVSIYVAGLEKMKESKRISDVKLKERHFVW